MSSETVLHKLAASMDKRLSFAQWVLDRMTSRGLVIVDDDPELLERIARALWNGTDERLPMSSAAKVVAALRGDKP